MATPPADTNLSLGKLGRATAVGNSDYTSETLMSDGAGSTTANSDHSLSKFYIGAVDSTLTGYLYVDESTNETYEITFTDENSLFASRIAARAGNFTWTTNNASLFNMSGTEDVTTQYNAGAIADLTSPQGVTRESNLVTDYDFDDWTGTTLLDQWTESGTINKKDISSANSPSGSNDYCVEFKSDGAYIEQSFTVKGNSTYQIRVLGKTSNGTDGQINLYISGSQNQLTRNAICGQEDDWYHFRDDFYTSGSSNVNQTLKLKFTADISNNIYPLLDTVYFERWEGANFGDTDVIITGKYRDAGQSDGFNDHATRYNTAISKTVEIQDTYAGQAIACFLPGTMIQMADGTEKDIEDIDVGDEVLSVIIPDLPDEDLGYNEWKTFSSEDNMTNLEVSTAKVEHIFYDYMDGYWNINDGLIKVTEEHDFWVLTEERWRWRKPTQLQIGEKLLDYEGNLIEITSFENIEGEVEVINFDVEPLDIYFAGGLLVHNKGVNSEP